MDDLTALSEILLERAATLADVHFENVIWDEAKHLSPEDLLTRDRSGHNS